MTKAHALKMSRIQQLSDKALFFIVLSILIATFSFYVFLVNKTIMNVVARENVSAEISSLSTSLGEREFKYISLKNSVTIDLAHAKGFQEAVPAKFIARSSTGPAISYNFAR